MLFVVISASAAFAADTNLTTDNNGITDNTLASVDEDKTDFNWTGSIPTSPINNIPSLYVIIPVITKITIEKIICPTKERKPIPVVHFESLEK